MPTMNEIAEALDIAASMVAAYTGYLDTTGHHDIARKAWSTSNKLAVLAEQVEQMRCETCEWFDDTRPTGCFYPGEEYDSDCAEITWCGPNFCCTHHKFNED